MTGFSRTKTSATFLQKASSRLKTKEQLAHLGPGGSPGKSKSNSPIRGSAAAGGPSAAEAAGIKTDARILKQKRQFEALLRQHKMDAKVQEAKRL